MHHFNIINPCDPYTMEAPDMEIAAVACAVLGEGMYALEEIGGDRSAQVPMFPRGGHDEWFTKQFGRNFADTLNHVATTRRTELIKALTSVHIGTPADKRAFDERAAQCADEEAMQALLHELHDARRTSIHDIGRHAWAMAQHLLATSPAAVAQAQAEAANATIQ